MRQKIPWGENILLYTGELYYVSALVGSDSYHGMTEDKPFATLTKAVTAAKGNSLCREIIVLTDLAGTGLVTIDGSGGVNTNVVTIKGKTGAEKLTRSVGTNDSVIEIQGGAKVSFKRIMIDGKYSDPVYHRGLYVTEAETKVTLGTKAVISGKVDSSGNGGGVYVADGARLEMTTDGTISNSTAYGGGRVFVDSSGGTFTMWGGNISHNTVSGIGSRGGGVYVRGGVGGSFTMWDGTISDNEAFTNGGGLSVYGNGTSFTMWGDEISGNIASTNGGGVGLDGGTGTSIFTMWGSVVYGNEAGNGDKKNTATNGTAFYKWRTTAQWNENKLGTLVDLTSTNDTLDLR